MSKFRLTSVDGQPDATVSFKVKVNENDVPKKVTDLNITKVETKCIDDNFRMVAGPTVSAELGDRDVKKQIGFRGSTVYTFSVDKRTGGTRWRVEGRLTKGASKVKEGRLEAFPNVSGLTDCRGSGSFSGREE